jgi:hypothetical protein
MRPASANTKCKACSTAGNNEIDDAHVPGRNPGANSAVATQDLRTGGASRTQEPLRPPLLAAEAAGHLACSRLRR